MLYYYYCVTHDNIYFVHNSTYFVFLAIGNYNNSIQHFGGRTQQLKNNTIPIHFEQMIFFYAYRLHFYTNQT